VAVLPVVAAAAALAIVSGLAVRERVRWPWLAWGWFWYLGTLVPVIGFVQVGGQALADRYTYVPLIGLFVAGVWGVSALASRWSVPRSAIAAAAAIVTLTFTALSWRQAGFWRDSVTLHERSVAVTEDNWKAWHGLCTAFFEEGRLREAASACEGAIHILPTFPEAWQSLGVIRAQEGDPEAAIPLFLRALELRPDYFNALHNLGSTFGNLGDNAQAVAYFRAALRIRPDDAETWSFLGLALLREGDRRGALDAAERLQSLDPERAGALRARIGP
jgi:tetratricopeptide (TPR) repeat protein